jgi:tetratricopeptide (TPR) repeat protein
MNHHGGLPPRTLSDTALLTRDLPGLTAFYRDYLGLLPVSQADMFIKQIEFYNKKKRPDAALLVAQEGLRLAPAIDHYATSVVRVLMDLARNAPREQAQMREDYLARAEATLQRARRANPLNMDNTRNLARVHRLWSALHTDPVEQTRHLNEAQSYYKQATQLSPNNASLWNEWALLYAERRQTDKALPLLNHSLDIDAGYTTTYWMRANLYLETGALDLALADYDRALAVDPKLLAAWSGKALALARLNRLDDAIEANLNALKVNPRDLISHRNLALLYQRTGRPDLALSEAEAALRLAKSATDKSALEEFIRQLQGETGSR